MLQRPLATITLTPLRPGNSVNDSVSLSVSPDVKRRLEALKGEGETWDDVINRLLDRAAPSGRPITGAAKQVGKGERKGRKARTNKGTLTLKHA